MAKGEAIEETPQSTLRPLPPLASTITTFVGRDENGPWYTRLEYLPAVAPLDPDRPENPTSQISFIPKILRGLYSRLENTEPDYMAALNDKIAFRNSQLDNLAGNKPAIDYGQALTERLMHADTVRDFVGPLVIRSMFNQRSGQPSEAKVRHQLEIANNLYGNDPLVSLSKEAAQILRDDELKHLARYTIGAAVAVVEYSGMYEQAPSFQTPSGTTDAA